LLQAQSRFLKRLSATAGKSGSNNADFIASQKAAMEAEVQRRIEAQLAEQQAQQAAKVAELEQMRAAFEAEKAAIMAGGSGGVVMQASAPDPQAVAEAAALAAGVAGQEAALAKEREELEALKMMGIDTSAQEEAIAAKQEQLVARVVHFWHLCPVPVAHFVCQSSARGLLDSVNID
jgi:hypothetical protein